MDIGLLVWHNEIIRVMEVPTMEEQNQQPAAEAPASNANDAQENKVMGILAYIGILVLIPLLTAKESEFAQYHAKQGLNLFIIGIANSIFINIPIIGWIGGSVIALGLFVIAIIGIINAANGEMKELPIIGGIQIIK